MTLGILLALTASGSDLCGPDELAAVEAAMGEVKAQYVAVDESAFDRASKQLDAAVSCLDEPPPGATVARLHQTMALVAFVNGQKGATRRALAAARLADPTWKLDPAVFPEGHAIWGHYAAAADPGPVREIGEIAPRSWVIDGVPRGEAPTGRAFLLQVATADRVVRSEYVYDFEDIPDLGQEQDVPLWATPHRLALGAALDARVLSADQTASGPGLSGQEAGKLGLGASLSVRYTPIAFFGVEAAGASLGGADPLLGGSFGAEAHAAGLFGAGVPAGEAQLYVNVRLGYARDTVISWSDGAGGVEQGLWSLDNVLGGAETGLRTEDLDLRLHGDALFAGTSGLYEIRAAGNAAFTLTGPVALEIEVTGRSGELDLTGADDQVVGVRRDLELRFGVGPTFWL